MRVQHAGGRLRVCAGDHHIVARGGCPDGGVLPGAGTQAREGVRGDRGLVRQAGGQYTSYCRPALPGCNPSRSRLPGCGGAAGGGRADHGQRHPPGEVFPEPRPGHLQCAA